MARTGELKRHINMPNRCARVIRKGGTVVWIVWQTGTARLPPRLLNDRKTGSMFLADSRAPPVTDRLIRITTAVAVMAVAVVAAIISYQHSYALCARTGNPA